MRIIVAATVCLWASAASAGWCDYGVPPPQYRQEPSVRYYVHEVSLEDLAVHCPVSPGDIAEIQGACVHTLIRSLDGDYAAIFIRNDLTDEEYECVVLHEKAHLPPNVWDHGPEWRSYKDKNGQWRPNPSPRWRRPVHVDPFIFVRGRVGNRVEEPMPDWLIEQNAALN